MDDLISRQWLMGCVEEGCIKFNTQEDENRFVHLIRDIAPSTQPDVPDTNVGDTISRQAAITLFEKYGATEDAIALLESLPSAQPEQTDCEYCHEDPDGYVRSIEKNSHAWLVRRGRTMKLRVGFKGEHCECDILFCPMCGRRLTCQTG